MTFALPMLSPAQSTSVCIQELQEKESLAAQDIQMETETHPLNEEQQMIREEEVTTPRAETRPHPQAQSTSAAHLKKKICSSTPLVDTEVRRSTRLKHKSNGYKSAHCADKNCFGCSAVPPTLSSREIKNLGEVFCKIPAAKLSEEALSVKKPGKKAAMAPGKAKEDDAKLQKKQAPSKKMAVKKKSVKDKDDEASKKKHKK